MTMISTNEWSLLIQVLSELVYGKGKYLNELLNEFPEVQSQKNICRAYKLICYKII